MKGHVDRYLLPGLAKHAMGADEDDYNNNNKNNQDF
jgi:hypothetical protein